MARYIFLFICQLMWVAGANAALLDRGGGLIYDTELDITWLQNANLSNSNILFWGPAVSWASNLEYYDPVRDVTWDDWRLPEDDLTCTGPVCDTSEMGHLFYVDGVTFANPGPFFNIQPGFYWYGTEVIPGEGTSFEFVTGVTSPLPIDMYDPSYAWAVRDGDVVPVPAAAWLFGSGLMVLIGLAKNRRARPNDLPG